MFPDMSCDDIFRLETSRLWLRWLRASDAPAVRGFASRAEVAHMTASIPHPYPPGEAERFILAARAATAAGQALILAITLKNRARTLIGLASAQACAPRDVEIGYVVGPDHAGHGYATEATTTLIDTVFNMTEANAVHADSRVINPASRRVLEKCGFIFVSTELRDLPARGGRHPCDVFVQTRRQRLQRERERLRPMAHQPIRDARPHAGPDERDEQQQQ